MSKRVVEGADPYKKISKKSKKGCCKSNSPF